jgi:hypothetical protein
LTLVLVAADPAAVSADPAPAPELLMYLGEFEDADGEFVDPMALESANPAASSDAKAQDGEDDEDPTRPG